MITALLVVTLSAVLVAGLLWRAQVAVRRVENQRQTLQARWVSRGSFDWTRLILRSEADSSPVTYLGGVWSVPIAPTRLSDFLGRLGAAREEQGASTWLSGSIEDAQAKINLRNLITTAGGAAVQVDPGTLAEVQKLFSLVGVRSEMAQAVAMRMRLSVMGSATRMQKAETTNAASAAEASQLNQTRPGYGRNDEPSGPAGLSTDATPRPIQIHTLEGLLDIPGMTPEDIDKLRPYLTVLPVPTQINLNTATAIVVAASIPEMSLPGAQGFVSSRDQAFFTNLADAQNRVSQFAPSVSGLNAGVFDVTSHFFLVHGRVQQERAVIDRIALIYRDGRTHATRVVQVRDADVL